MKLSHYYTIWIPTNRTISIRVIEVTSFKGLERSAENILRTEYNIQMGNKELQKRTKKKENIKKKRKLPSSKGK
jgi:hypothetical protein